MANDALRGLLCLIDSSIDSSFWSYADIRRNVAARKSVFGIAALLELPVSQSEVDGIASIVKLSPQEAGHR